MPAIGRVLETALYTANLQRARASMKVRSG